MSVIIPYVSNKLSGKLLVHFHCEIRQFSPKFYIAIRVFLWIGFERLKFQDSRTVYRILIDGGVAEIWAKQ